MSIRSSAVAGMFYPDDPDELRANLEALLQHSNSHQILPKAIIVPHAGYIYSGPVAASAYVSFYNQHCPVSRVVLMGPAHRVGFPGIAASRADYFATPLGKIAVDHTALQPCIDSAIVSYFDPAHEHEHCLEVQLPFIQQIFEKRVKIIPLLVGKADCSQVADVLRVLWNGPQTLIVISSDLSHYHDYESAKRLDMHTTRLIEQFYGAGLNAESACGRLPIQGLLHVAKEAGLHCTTIDLRNSGDTAGAHHRVVGYGAYIFY